MVLYLVYLFIHVVLNQVYLTHPCGCVFRLSLPHGCVFGLSLSYTWLCEWFISLLDVVYLVYLYLIPMVVYLVYLFHPRGYVNGLSLLFTWLCICFFGLLCCTSISHPRGYVKEHAAAGGGAEEAPEGAAGAAPLRQGTQEGQAAAPLLDGQAGPLGPYC